MSLYLVNKAIADTFEPRKVRVINQQFQTLQQLRKPGHPHFEEALALINAGLSPAEAYREMDVRTKIDMVPAGERATMSRLMQNSRSVHIGREAFDYRRSSGQSTGQTSMSGQVATTSDKSDYSYKGTPIPIHTKGYALRWRESEGAAADGFDVMVDQNREAERFTELTINNYLWNGDAKAKSPNGRTWLGIKADPSVATATLGVDLTTATPEQVSAEVARVADILWITNNCANGLRLGISREIMSYWEQKAYATTGTGTGQVFGNVLNYIKGMRYFVEVYEDSELSGNQLVMYWDNELGFHSVVGMALSTYAVPRVMPTDDYNFVKMAAVGFLAREDYSDRKCVLYAS